MAPLIACLWVLAASTVATWLLSVLTKEYSWVDRVWSIVPIVYLWIFAGAAGFADPRLDLMAGIVTLWGARLTFNFSRKGGYSRGGEDYRWSVLRSRMSHAAFQAFNLGFIAIAQNVVLFLIAMPAFMAYQNRATPVGWLDLVLVGLFLAFLVGETVADQQQWDFHRWKRAETASGRTPRPGFLTAGLFRVSRHPNYFFELAQWWTLFAIGSVAAGTALQWTVAGPVLLTVVFIGSTAFTESITGAKYPEYAGYRAATSAIVPWPPRSRKGQLTFSG